MNKSIEKIMREAFPTELPYGFAERVAFNALRQGSGSSIWDLLLNLSPRVSMAFGAVTILILAFGLTGDGPNVVDAMANYETYSNFISLP